eukprot:3280035-Pleurochrysis_carterae.AAC.1
MAVRDINSDARIMLEVRVGACTHTGVWIEHEAKKVSQHLYLGSAQGKAIPDVNREASRPVL